MKRLALTLAILSACSSYPWDKRKDDPGPAPQTIITNEQFDQLRVIRDETRLWAKSCYTSLDVIATEGITCFDDSDGDSALYAGIACLSGERDQCYAVLKCQSWDDGKLWRSPARVGKDTENSSSRDMLLGGIAMAVLTKDTKFLTSLVGYIHAHHDKLCEDAVDNRCDVGMPTYAAIWGTLQKVYVYLGLTPDVSMMAGDVGDSTLISLQSQFSPAGYQKHLPMVEMLIRQKINTWDSTLEKGAVAVADSEPNNPFYEYVARGATYKAAQLAIEQCEGPEPQNKWYWTWQEDDDKQRWTSRNGWDCVSLINLLIGTK